SGCRVRRDTSLCVFRFRPFPRALDDALLLGPNLCRRTLRFFARRGRAARLQAPGLPVFDETTTAAAAESYTANAPVASHRLLFISQSDHRVDAGRPSYWEISCKRSEEHTSELQSPDHLVCRLLLEKKKKNKIIRKTNKCYRKKQIQ